MIRWSVSRIAVCAAGVCLLALAGSFAGAADAKPGQNPAPAVAGDPYKLLVSIDFGTGDEIAAAINQEVIGAKPEQFPAIEQKLLAVLQDKSATLVAKQQVCRFLRLVGSQACLPALAELLLDAKVSHMARYALQGMNSAAADETLRAALDKTTGNVRIGIINTLADRRDGQSVPVIAKLLTADEPTVVAALRGLARIGNADAAKVLMQASVSQALAGALDEARLVCAQRLVADGNGPAAAAVYTELFAESHPALIRQAALAGMARIDREKVIPLIIEAIKSKEKSLQQGAIAAAIEIREPSANAAFAQALPGLPSGAKIALLNALAERKLPQELTAVVNPLVNDADQSVRQAAVLALRTLGDASTVAVLASIIKDKKELAGEAAQTLKYIYADGVVEALMSSAKDGDANVRVAMLGVLGERHETAALPLTLQCMRDADKNIRKAAYKTLGQLGGAQEIDTLLAAMLACKDDGEQDAIGSAISTIAKRNDDTEARVKPIVNAMASAEQQAQLHLLSVLGTLGGKAAMNEFKKALQSPLAEVKKSAIRSLGEWPDDSPIKEMLALAQNDPDEASRILALRGFIRMIGLPKHRKDEQALAFYQDAWKLAKRNEEKKQVLGGLANVHRLESLQIVQTCFEEKALQNEACSAALKIIPAIADKNRNEAKAALERIIKVSTNKDHQKQAKEELGKLGK